MGAICSGKSENPASIDPPKSHQKENTNPVASMPKIAYSQDQKTTDTDTATGKLEIEKSDVQNIQVSFTKVGKDEEEAQKSAREEQEKKESEEAERVKREQEE